MYFTAPEVHIPAFLTLACCYRSKPHGCLTPGYLACFCPACSAGISEDSSSSVSSSAGAQAAYGTTSWAISAALQLAGSRVLHHSESKKMMLQSIILLLTGHGAKWADTVLFLQLLQLLEVWLTQPPLALSLKEAVLLLQRLAHVDQDRWDSPSMKQAWQTRFLDMLLLLCTNESIPTVRRGRGLGGEGLGVMEMC